MKRLIIPSLICLISDNLFISSAHASSNEYVILESIRAVNTTVTLQDNLVYELNVLSPSTFQWVPTESNSDGALVILLCTEEIVDLNTEPISCNFNNKMSQYRIANVGNVSTTNENEFTRTTFTVSGKPTINQVGKYFVYMVRLPRSKINDPYYHSLYYYYNRNNVIDSFDRITGLSNVNYSNTFIDVLEELPSNQPDPEPLVEDPPVPVVEVSPPRGRNSGSSQPEVSMLEPIVESVIQSNFYLPSIKGDENWRPLREIKGNFQDWKRLRKNSINGGMNQVTKKDGSLITFTSSGDSFSLRYLGGKKRGSFSIYVNGKFLERVDAKRSRKTQLIKTWQGLGTGKHYIDIVAELEEGQSLALNGIQRPRI